MKKIIKTISLFFAVTKISAQPTGSKDGILNTRSLVMKMGDYVMLFKLSLPFFRLLDNINILNCQEYKRVYYKLSLY